MISNEDELWGKKTKKKKKKNGRKFASSETLEPAYICMLISCSFVCAPNYYDT